MRHPWERARFAFLRRLLERHAKLDARRVLDVGSGDAWLATQWLAALPSGARITCVDAEYTDDVVTALALPTAIETRTDLARVHGDYAMAMALDVAEHVEDDVAFLGALTARIERGGTLLFTVPAWPALYSQHDRDLGHFRRYTHASARALLATTGLRIVEDGGFFHALVAPRLLALGKEKLLGEAPASNAPDTGWRHGDGAARLVAGVLELEQALTHRLGTRGLSAPGLSYYALAVRD